MRMKLYSDLCGYEWLYHTLNIVSLSFSPVPEPSLVTMLKP